MEDPVVVESVEALAVRPLRHAVLRPGGADEKSTYQADDHPDSAHVAARITGHATARITGHAMALGTGGPFADVVSVGTVMRQAPPWEPGRPNGWRVRGMATRPDFRRRGLGGLVLDALLDHVAAHGGGLVWCNARVPAQQLYGRAGFVTRGEVFELPGVGPHHLMWRTVDGADCPTPSS